MVRVLLWAEEDAAPLAAALRAAGGVEVAVTGPADPDQGTSPAALAEARVLLWRGRAVAASSLTDRAVRRIVTAVTNGRLGVVLDGPGPADRLAAALPAGAGEAGGRDMFGAGRICRVPPGAGPAALLDAVRWTAGGVTA